MIPVCEPALCYADQYKCLHKYVARFIKTTCTHIINLGVTKDIRCMGALCEGVVNHRDVHAITPDPYRPGCHCTQECMSTCRKRSMHMLMCLQTGGCTA